MNEKKKKTTKSQEENTRRRVNKIGIRTQEAIGILFAKNCCSKPSCECGLYSISNCL